MDVVDDLTQPWPHLMTEQGPIAQSRRSLGPFFCRASGSAHCTVTDLVRFGLLATNSTEKSQSLLKPKTWEMLGAPVPNTTTTLGSFNLNSERSSYSRNGSLGTALSNLVVVPDWRVAVAVCTNIGGDEVQVRGTDLILDAIRKRRAELQPPTPCRIALTDVDAVDVTWQNVVLPKSSDSKLRVRVKFQVELEGRTGDIELLVKIGDVERHINRFRGLTPGNYEFHFAFDTPKWQIVPALVQLDALGTAGNLTVERATFKSQLNLT